ncbi:MAG: peptidylprolyl isomerase [Pseudomonadota bacterium]
MFSVIRRIITDRFTIFALIGMSFFFVDGRFSDHPNEIRIGHGDIAMLEGRWELQTGSKPNAAELDALIDFHIREEVLVREARRLGLDQDDVILRRRLAQKMELLLRDDGLDDMAITAGALEDFYGENPQRYSVPKNVGFKHIYLGTGSAELTAAVDLITSELRATQDPEHWRSLGRPFMLAREYAPRTEASFREVFGADFATRLMEETEPGEWWGPVQSAYGWHLVQTQVVQDARTLSLAEVRDQVATDVLEARSSDRTRDKLGAVIAQYNVYQDWRDQ